jgi:hypothetical protein
MFLDHTQRRNAVGRIPVDEWSSRRRDLYLTTHNTHKKQTSMPSAGFEPTISAGERPKIDALDSAATGMGASYMIMLKEYEHVCIQIRTLVSSNRLCERGHTE